MTESTFITAWLVVGALLGLAQFPLIVWLGARYGRTVPALGWPFGLRLLAVATLLSWSMVGGHIVGVPVPSLLALYWALRDGTAGAAIVPPLWAFPLAQVVVYTAAVLASRARVRARPTLAQALGERQVRARE